MNEIQHAMPSLQSWLALWQGLGARKIDEALYHRLRDCYGERHRHYHTLQHLDECLSWMQQVREYAQHPHEIELALWFHDAIYDVTRQDNEARSAQWALAALQEAGVADDIGERVHDLVMATRHNQIPQGADAEVLVDIDLAILSSAPERYREFERQVREEYAWVPALVFRMKRRQILSEFEARPRIYATAPFAGREADARRNLRWAIENLGGR